MKTFKQDFKTNPLFNTVVGLTNTTFDPENYVANRGATEGQIKIVHDMIKALQDWLDEHGCSDDPYAIIKAKVDQLEAAIDECCANPQDSVVQILNDRMDGIETAMDTCCQAMDENLYQTLVNRLNELEQNIIQCCADYEAKVQELLDNLIIVRDEDGFIDRNVFTECGDDAITLSYEVDISQETEVTEYEKLVGKITGTANITGRYIAGYRIGGCTSSESTAYHHDLTYGFRIEGHENITFKINASANGGFIYMRKFQPAIRSSWYINQRDEILPIIGTNGTYQKLFFIAIDNERCYAEIEVPISEFDFSNIDSNSGD